MLFGDLAISAVCRFTILQFTNSLALWPFAPVGHLVIWPLNHLSRLALSVIRHIWPLVTGAHWPLSYFDLFAICHFRLFGYLAIWIIWPFRLFGYLAIWIIWPFSHLHRLFGHLYIWPFWSFDNLRRLPYLAIWPFGPFRKKEVVDPFLSKGSGSSHTHQTVVKTTILA